jgi:ASC-1-like (ASCH) protein
MEVLHLTLKKKWFDMIASGEKKEEYRVIKPYWIKRLRKKKFDAIRFRNGYSKDAPVITVELRAMTRGRGIVEWGAPEHPVFILHLGEIID